jgi:hypothetical protein
MLIPATVLSKAYVTNRLIASIMGLNPAEDLDVHLLCFV